MLKEWNKMKFILLNIYGSLSCMREGFYISVFLKSFRIFLVIKLFYWKMMLLELEK